MSVPKLDLAPKLKRLLSLWNPLDYLRLLYWSIFFPQAFTWYLKNWAGGDIPLTLINIKKRWQLRWQNSNRRNLLIQELILIFICAGILSEISVLFGINDKYPLFVFIGSCTFGLLLNSIWNIGLGITGTLAFGVPFGVPFGVKLGMKLGANLDVASSVAYSVALGVAYSVALGMVLGLVLGVADVVAFNVAFSVAYGVAYGIAYGVVLGVAYSVVFSVVSGVALSVVLGIIKFMLRGLINKIFLSVVLGVALGVALGEVFGVALGVGFGVAFGVVSWNPVNWLISLIFNPIKAQNSPWKFSHVTLLPNIRLIAQLQKWLQQDWQIGIHNTNQILEYTWQSSHVLPPIRRVLKTFPDEQVIYRVNQLVEGTNNWQLIRSLVKFNSQIPSFATTNGFWYLHKKQPENATEAFAVVRNLLYGEEVFILARTLAVFKEAKTPNQIAKLTLPDFPTENLLRPTTWQTMNRLRRVVEDIKLIQHSAARNTKSFAYSRAIGELTEVIDNQDSIPEAERALIVEIAQTWKQSLERIGKDIGNVTITQPVTNPYVIGNPVTGSLFVGREDILRQLEEVWITSNQLQSVVLFGHRRMGKTSILVNVANCTGAEIKVVYINLQGLGAVSQGVAEVLMAISDEIASAVKLPPPDDDKLLQFPQRTFKNYLKQVIAEMPYKGLIIALDEFEFIEELIQRGQIEATFMGFLRGLVQMNPAKIAFAFAGLHTLEEMTADYFQPFFASVIAIPVSFLNKGATKAILANPSTSPPTPLLTGKGGNIENRYQHQDRGKNDRHSENKEFLLDYTGEALDLIYDLTSGQPYLVQLIGFQLVRNYNDSVFERGVTRDNTFTVADIEAIIDRKFFQQGRYYFEGVWGQAAQDEAGQQAIIKAIAPDSQGLSRDNLITITGLDIETLDAAIKTLIRHDVIAVKDGNYYIIVELFRRWVVDFMD